MSPRDLSPCLSPPLAGGMGLVTKISLPDLCSTIWPRFNPLIRMIFWRRKWQPTLVFVPGESHGQRSLVCYSPWDRKELDMTEVT